MGQQPDDDADKQPTAEERGLPIVRLSRIQNCVSNRSQTKGEEHMKKFDFDKLVSSDVSKLLGNAMESYAKLSEEQDDVVFYA